MHYKVGIIDKPSLASLHYELNGTFVAVFCHQPAEL